jgi:hypothetical protein
MILLLTNHINTTAAANILFTISIISIIISPTVELPAYRARGMNEERNAYRVWDRKSEGKMPLGRSRQTLVLILAFNRQMGNVVPSNAHPF